MFTVEIIRNRKRKQSGPCAVDLTKGIVIPFSAHWMAAETVALLNKGTSTSDCYFNWYPEECEFLNGDPVRPEVLDTEAPAPYSDFVKVEVTGLNFDVPKPVADYLAHLKNTVFNLAMAVSDLQEEQNHRN
jgi:hypothetical protein